MFVGTVLCEKMYYVSFLMFRENLLLLFGYQPYAVPRPREGSS